MTARIEKDIPLDTQVGRGKVSRWPFEDMEVGDSIPLDNIKELKAARNAAYLYRKRNEGWDYGSVKYPDDSGRLWRVS